MSDLLRRVERLEERMGGQAIEVWYQSDGYGGGPAVPAGHFYRQGDGLALSPADFDKYQAEHDNTTCIVVFWDEESWRSGEQGQPDKAN